MHPFPLTKRKRRQRADCSPVPNDSNPVFDQTNVQSSIILDAKRRRRVARLSPLLLRFALLVRFKEHSQLEHFGRRVPARDKATFALVDLFVGDFKRDILVRSSSKDQILKVLIGGLHFLLERTHKTMPRLQAWLDLGILDLEEKAALASRGVAEIVDSIGRKADFNARMVNHFRNRGRNERHRLGSLFIHRLYNLYRNRKTNGGELSWLDAFFLACEQGNLLLCCVP